MIQKAIRAWDSFWFHPLDLYNLALMRMILAWTWLVMYGLRMWDFEIFFSESGVLPAARVSEMTPEILQSVFPFYFVNE